MKRLISAIVVASLILSGCSAVLKTPIMVNNYSPTINANSSFNISKEPVKLVKVKAVYSIDVTCLARTIYYEARGESRKGQIAVGYVIINRTKLSDYPSTICGVVKQAVYRNGRLVCQFSWYCNGGNKTLTTPLNNVVYKHCEHLARAILEGEVDNNIQNAIYFHMSRQHRVNLDWKRRGLILVKTIGGHSFYKDG